MLRLLPAPSPSTPLDQWYQLYQSAMLELDDIQLPSRIAEARRAIYARAEKSLTVTKEGERRDLMDAIHSLDLLEKVATRERLEALKKVG
jgi:hypothetical protein